MANDDGEMKRAHKDLEPMSSVIMTNEEQTTGRDKLTKESPEKCACDSEVCGQLLLDQGFSQHSNVCGMRCDPAHLKVMPQIRQRWDTTNGTERLSSRHPNNQRNFATATRLY